MHRTRSLDYAIILSGEIDMMLDDGDVHLKPGDVIVQQATNHAWVNRGKEPCRIILVPMGLEGAMTASLCLRGDHANRPRTRSYYRLGLERGHLGHQCSHASCLLRRTKFDSRPGTALPGNDDGVWGYINKSVDPACAIWPRAARTAAAAAFAISRASLRIVAELVSLAETSNGRLGSIGMYARDLAAPRGFPRRCP